MLMIELEKIERIEREIRELKSETDRMDEKIKKFEDLLKLLKMLKPNPLFVEMISKAKNDEKFFSELVNFLKRDKGKRETILAITKKNLLDGCKDIKL